jgi:integrase
MTLWKRCEHRGRQRDNCEHPWWIVRRIRRRRVQVSIEKYFGVECRGRGSKTKAYDFETKIRELVLSGAFDRVEPEAAAPAGPLTFKRFVDVYCDGYGALAGLRSLRDRRGRLKMAAAYFGDRLLSDIRRADVIAYLGDLKARGKTPATVRRHYAYLHHAFGWAVRDAGLLASSPTGQGIRLEQESDGRSRRLEGDEEERLRKVTAADPFLDDCITVALDTGLRAGSILQLQVSMLRLAVGKHGAIAVPGRAVKSKEPLVLPLTARVRVIVDRRAKGPTGVPLPAAGFLFGNGVGEPFKSLHVINDRWRAAVRLAGLEDLRFHDLRGEAASRLADLGVPVRVIQRFLGHSTIAMTQRYLRLRVGAVEDGVDMLEQYVERAARKHGTSTEASTVVPFQKASGGH